jgi:WD40 repeat protein
MKRLRVQLAAALACFSVATAYSQLLPSQAKGAARSQIVMLSVDGGCAAGIILGFDDKAIYVGTAAHVADLSKTPFPAVTVKFEGIGGSGRRGTFWSKFESQDKGDFAVITIDRDEVLAKFLNDLDFAILSSVPISPADSPVTSIGCFGGAEWSSGSNETLLAPDQGYLRFQSNVGEGQSGGGLFNEAWELIGMPLDVGPNGVYARPIAEVLDRARRWGVPVRLLPRPVDNRVRGADEVARENAAVAKSRELASAALGVGPSAADLGLLLSVEAIKIKDTPEARGSVLQLLAQTKNLGGILGPRARGAKSLAFAPDGKTVAISLPGAVAVWDVETRDQLQRFPLKEPAAESVAVSHDGRIAAGTKDGDLIVWGREEARQLLHVHVGEFVMSIAFDPEGSRVAAGDIEGKVVVTSIKDASTIRLAGEQGPTHSLWLNGQSLIAGGGQGFITRWDLTKQENPKTSFIGAGQPLTVAYDERLMLFSGYTNGSNVPYVNDAKTGYAYHDRELGGTAVEIDELAFTADGAVLAGATVRGSIALWDTATGRRQPQDLVGHPGKIEALAFAPGNHLLAAGGPGGVTLFDLRTQSLVSSISASGQESINEVPNVVRAGISAAFSPDGSLIAWPVGVAERSVVVWDLVENKERARFNGDGVYAFSEDGRELSVETFDSDTANVFSLPKGKLPRSEPARKWRSRVKGSLGVTNGQPWAVDNGQGLGASIVLDGTLTLWDTTRRLPLGSLVIPGAIEASYLVFDNKGKRLAVATSGGALSLVDVYLPSWISRACALAGRELDTSEWRRYVGNDRSQEPTCAMISRNTEGQ